MKKAIILILMIFLLSGCDAIYQAEITDDGIIESTYFLANENDTYSTNPDPIENPNGPSTNSSIDEVIDAYYNQDYPAFDNDMSKKDNYQKDKISYEDRLGLSLKYTYSLADYGKSSLIHYCYEDIKIQKSKKYLIFDIKDNSKCFTQDIYEKLDSLTIKITSPDIVESNADSISGNTHTWILTKENNLKDIYIRKRLNGDKAMLTLKTLLGICICGCLSFAIVYIRKGSKNKKKN